MPAAGPPRAGGSGGEPRHDRHESPAYVIEGGIVLWFGERLEHRLTARPGDFIYIPGGVPHLVANGSQTEPAVAVLARNDASEQEDVTVIPQLSTLPRLQLEGSR